MAKPPAKPKDQAEAAKNQQKPDELPVDMFSVNGKVVNVGAYASFLQRNPQIISRAVNTDAGKIEAVREMIASALLVEAMQQEGLLEKKAGGWEASVMAAAYEKLAERHFPRPSVPEEKAAYQYYLDHQDEFGIPAMTRVRQILVKVAKGADDEVKKRARERAEAILNRVDSGESFQQLAASLTENPVGKLTEGDIGFIGQGTPDAVRELLKEKKAGEHTGVVETSEGFEILQVMDTRPALVAPYANVREKVIKQSQDTEQNKTRMAYVKTLAKSAKIDIIEPSLKAIMPKEIFD